MKSHKGQHFQLGLHFRGNINNDDNLLSKLDRLIGECGVCGIGVIGFGETSWVLDLAELAFANSVPVVWLASSEENPIARPHGLTVVTVPGGAAQLVDTANRSVNVVVTCGAGDADGLLIEQIKQVDILTLFNVDQTQSSPLGGLQVLPRLMEMSQQKIVDISADEAMRDGYQLLWKGYPSSNEDARTTWGAIEMFRRAILAATGDPASLGCEQEALLRIHEAAGSYHYYQRDDNAAALRYFAQGALNSDPETVAGRFVRALAIETIGLLAFDLRDYAIAECAARQARAAYVRSRADCAPTEWFYFDHTLEGLTGDAEVYKAYALANEGKFGEARAALEHALSSYRKALAIQPLWLTNKTCDTYASALNALEALERRMPREDHS